MFINPVFIMGTKENVDTILEQAAAAERAGQKGRAALLLRYAEVVDDARRGSPTRVMVV